MNINLIIMSWGLRFYGFCHFHSKLLAKRYQSEIISYTILMCIKKITLNSTTNIGPIFNKLSVSSLKQWFPKKILLQENYNDLSYHNKVPVCHQPYTFWESTLFRILFTKENVSMFFLRTKIFTSFSISPFGIFHSC